MIAENPLMLGLGGIPDERRFSLLRELQRSLKDGGLNAEPVWLEDGSGNRGDLSLFGQIAIDLVKSGAIAGLIACLKVYFAREPKLTVEITSKNGPTFKLNASNISEAGLKDILRQITSDKN